MDVFERIKQPDEEYYIEFDFTNDLGDSTIDEVLAVLVTAYGEVEDLTESIVDSTLQTNDTKIVYLWLKDGTPEGKYHFRCTIKAAPGGEVYMLNGLLSVAEVV